MCFRSLCEIILSENDLCDLSLSFLLFISIYDLSEILYERKTKGESNKELKISKRVWRGLMCSCWVEEIVELNYVSNDVKNGFSPSGAVVKTGAPDNILKVLSSHSSWAIWSYCSFCHFFVICHCYKKELFAINWENVILKTKIINYEREGEIVRYRKR